MKIIITGATGMVGSEVLRQAITDDDISEITIIVRRPVHVSHPKLKTIIHTNFSDYSNLIDAFKNIDAVIWCLGISQNLVTKEEYIKITFDYAVTAAREMLQANTEISFLFLSGAGADNTEKSRFLFGRIKGKTENALMKMPFKKLYIARPGAIIPIHKPINLPFITKLQNWFVKFFALFAPSLAITSVALAKVLLYIVKANKPQQLFYQKYLKELSKQL